MKGEKQSRRKRYIAAVASYLRAIVKIKNLPVFTTVKYFMILCVFLRGGIVQGNSEIKYKLMDDGTSFAVQCKDYDIHRMCHSSKTSIVKAIDIFNRGVKRGDTILVTGDKPRFAMMRTYREVSMSPDLIKLGDGRIRLQHNGKSYWFDESEDIYTVFRPSCTEYRLRFTFLKDVTFRLIVSQANEWGVIAKVSVENKRRESVDLKIDMVYGGLSRHGRTFTASYFSPDPKKEQSNIIDVQEQYSIISEKKISDQMIVSSRPAVKAQKEGTKVKFTFSIQVEADTTQSVCIVAGYGADVKPLTSTIVEADLESLMNSSKTYYQDMLSKYQISTPSQILDCGFRTAVLNLDNIYQDQAWLEGVHWWSSYWTNLFQISAAVSLDQVGRAKKALEFYNNKKEGPAPLYSSCGDVAGSNEEGLPYYLYSLFQYYDHTGDKEFIREVWPKLSQSLDKLFMERDKDGNGLINWRLHCNPFLYQADHLGMPGDAASPSLMIAGMVERMSQIAEDLGKTEESLKWQTHANIMYANLVPTLWNQDAGCFYNHRDLQGLRHMGHYYTDMVFPVLYTRLDTQYSWQSLEYLKQNLLLKDSSGKMSLMRVGELKPTIFGNDNVMPTQMAEAARAFFAVGDYEQGKDLLDSVALAGTIFTEAPGNFPERMSDKGKGEANYLFGNPIGSFIYSVTRGLFGVSVINKGQTLDWSPSFCADWSHASLTLPYAKVFFQRNSTDGQIKDRYVVEHNVKRQFRFSTFLPDSQIQAIRSNGKSITYSVKTGLKKSRVELALDPNTHHDIEIDYVLRDIHLQGPSKIYTGYKATWQCNEEIDKISDPQNVLKTVSVKKNKIEAIVSDKIGTHQFFVHIKNRPIVYPVLLTVSPLYSITCKSAVYDPSLREILIKLKTDVPSLKGALKVQLYNFSVTVPLSSSCVTAIFKDIDMPAEGVCNLYYTLKKCDDTVVYQAFEKVGIQGINSDVTSAMCTIRDAQTEYIDLSNFYNSSHVEGTSFWRDNKQVPIDYHRFLTDGIWNTPVGSFKIPAEGPYIAMIQLGKSHPVTREIVKVEFPDKMVLPIGKKVRMVSLLYADEIESRLTNSQVGVIRLVYDDMEEVKVPLVVCKNIDSLYTHFSTDTYGIDVGKEGDWLTANSFVNILRLSCDPNRLLQSVVFELEALDVQMGIMAVSVVAF